MSRSRRRKKSRHSRRTRSMADVMFGILYLFLGIALIIGKHFIHIDFLKEYGIILGIMVLIYGFFLMLRGVTNIRQKGKPATRME